jgi:HK97 family phage prohead protease
MKQQIPAANRRAAFEQVRAAMDAMDEVRSLDEQRKLSDAEQACLNLVRSCRAMTSAAVTYSYDVPNVVSDDVYYTLRDCYDCCDTFIGLLYRQSALVPDAAELCAAGCNACVEACGDSADPMLQACVTSCKQTAEACGAMATMDDGQRAARRQKFEVRGFAEVRASAADQAPKIEGYPIVFGTLSEPLMAAGGKQFRERIEPGAIQFTDDVRADFNHDSNFILGRASKGTLSLSIDAKGVAMRAIPPDTQWARDLVTSVERGDIDQGSFAFRVLPGGEQWIEENGEIVRNLTKILVSRVSVVSDPAYTATKLQVRGVDEILAGRPKTAINPGQPAGQAAPPAPRGAVGLDLLRRRIDLAEAEA